MQILLGRNMNTFLKKIPEPVKNEKKISKSKFAAPQSMKARTRNRGIVLFFL
jgi:hypothetical protein